MIGERGCWRGVEDLADTRRGGVIGQDRLEALLGEVAHADGDLGLEVVDPGEQERIADRVDVGLVLGGELVWGDVLGVFGL